MIPLSWNGVEPKRIPKFIVWVHWLHAAYTLMRFIMDTEEILLLKWKNVSPVSCAIVFSKHEGSLCCVQVKVSFLKNDGVIWYWKFCSSDMLRNMTSEVAKCIDRIMPKCITSREHGILSANCTWITITCTKCPIFQGPHYHHIQLKQLLSVSNARCECLNGFCDVYSDYSVFVTE